MTFAFQAGDILFQDIGCGAICDAINGVTPGYRGAEINHCGIVVEVGAKSWIIEAIYPQVSRRPLREFLNRSLDELGRPRVMAGRLRDDLRGLIAPALQFCHERLGAPYDIHYLDDPSALYCSELIVDAFAHANGGIAVFPEHPMSFRDPVTGDIHPFWAAYYGRFGLEVPDGKPGSNPGTLSLDDKISIVAQLGALRGASLA